jgi:hypothetical protein
LEDRNIGITGDWGAGVLEYGSIGVLEEFEEWNNGE